MYVPYNVGYTRNVAPRWSDRLEKKNQKWNWRECVPVTTAIVWHLKINWNVRLSFDIQFIQIQLTHFLFLGATHNVFDLKFFDATPEMHANQEINRNNNLANSLVLFTIYYDYLSIFIMNMTFICRVHEDNINRIDIRVRTCS